MKQEYNLLTGALRVFKDFSLKNCNEEFSYDFNNASFELLKKKYHIEQIAGNGDELSKVLKLLRWCCDNILHNGGTKDVDFVPKTSIDILDYSFQKGYEYGVYCRLQAIVFSEICLALGIKSRILHCLPFSPYDFDTHVVSIVYLSSLNKWIMVDPGNNGYFLDLYNNILSPMEIRSKLANNEHIHCNTDIFPNVSDLSFEDKEKNYKTYMAKNLFYFKSLKFNTYGSDLLHNQKTIYCIPIGFDIHNREIAYCEYAINNTPEHLADDWKNALYEFRHRNTYDFLDEQHFFS